MGSIERMVAVARNTYRETVRERVLYNLVFFAVLMMLSGLLLNQLSIRQDEKILKDLGLAAMDLFGTVIAVFVGVGLVSKEIERRSLHPILAKPMARHEFLLGKLLGLAFTLLVNIAAMTVGLFATLFLSGRGTEAALLKAVYLIYVGLLVTVSVALLFSSVTTSALAAVLCSIGAVVAGRYSDILRNAGTLAEGGLGWLGTVLYYVLPNWSYFDVKRRVVYHDPVPAALLVWSTGYAVAYVVVAMSLALLAFRRRDLT
jgi:ABC-type transport system involved in multi-copper enzyme maturation permease subunit